MAPTAEIYSVNAPRDFSVHGFEVTKVTVDTVGTITVQESDADIVFVVVFSSDGRDDSLANRVFESLARNPSNKLRLILFGPFARTPKVPASQHCFGDHSCRGERVYSRSQELPDYAALATRVFSRFDITPVLKYEDAESESDTDSQRSSDGDKFEPAPDAEFCERYRYVKESVRNKSFLRDMAEDYDYKSDAIEVVQEFLEECQENSYCGDPEDVADSVYSAMIDVIERIKVDPVFKAAANTPAGTECEAVDRFARMTEKDVRGLVETKKDCRLLQFKVHPDKNPGCANATEASKIVNRVCGSMKGGGTRIAATWASLAAVTVLAAFLG